MSRLPIPGQDKGVWGSILNDYLSQSLSSTGSLNPNVVTADQIAPGSISDTEIADGTITSLKLDTTTQTTIEKATTSVQSINNKFPTSGAVTLVASDVGAPTTLAGDTDVSITSPSSGHILSYDATTNTWKNTAQSTSIKTYVSGLAGNGTTDDSTTIQTLLNNLGSTASDSNEVIVDAGSTGSVYINGVVEIQSNNTILRFNSPVIMGPNATLRIWGGLSENPAAGQNRPRLTANAASGATQISVNNVSYFTVGCYIIIRGLKDVNGNPLQTMNNTVTAINGSTLTLGTPLDSAYSIQFTGSAYPSNYTEVTAVVGSPATAGATRGSRTITVTDSSRFSVGNIVQILDDDLNTGSDGSTQTQNYLHREFADIKQIVDSTHIRISHALHHTYDLANNARVIVTNPVINSHIVNANVTWSAMSTVNAAFWMEYSYGSSIENCSVTGDVNDGF